MRIDMENWVIQTLSFFLVYLKNGLLGNKNDIFNAYVSCSVCKLGKSKTILFLVGARCTSTYFEMTHSDVRRMYHVVSQDHYKYFITFIGDYTHLTWKIFFDLNLKCFLCLRNF